MIDSMAFPAAPIRHFASHMKTAAYEWDEVVFYMEHRTMNAGQSTRDLTTVAATETIQGPSGHCTIRWGGKPTVRDLNLLRKYIELRLEWEREWEAEAKAQIPVPRTITHAYELEMDGYPA